MDNEQLAALALQLAAAWKRVAQGCEELHRAGCTLGNEPGYNRGVAVALTNAALDLERLINRRSNEQRRTGSS